MPGPKYVTDFEFPASAGFTRSGRNDVTVKSHVRHQPVKLARGGSVRRAISDVVKSPKTVIGTGGVIGAGAAYLHDKATQRKQAAKAPKPPSTVDTLRGTTRRQRERELGLAKGGAPRYAKGGRVEGNALVQRDNPTTEQDKVSGGKTPLRPGFQKGGQVPKGDAGINRMSFSQKSRKTLGTGTKKNEPSPKFVPKPVKKNHGGMAC